jgi:hypothetical protein
MAVLAVTTKGESHMTTAIAPRSLSTIALEIRMDWKQVYFGAVPYLDAMACLDKVTDAYSCDSGKSIALYFLSNARTWKGEVAKRIKAELKGMVK